MKDLDKVFSKFKEVDAVVLAKPADTFYLTGYDSDFGVVFLCDGGRYYFTDERYAEEAEACFGDALKVVPVSLLTLFGKLSEYVEKSGAERIGMEYGFVTCDLFEMVKGALGDREIVAVDDVLADLRAVKSRDEIALIRQAAKIADRAFSQTLKKVRAGITERQLCAELEYRMKKLGADDPSFKTIVAFGENTSRPHAHVSDKRLEEGMPVTIDFGCKYRGWCSDCTRTFAFGEPGEEFRKLYAAVLESNLRGIDAVRPGVECSAVDKACRDCLDSRGYEGLFLHGTGHGVGTEIHEPPTLRDVSFDVLKKNMIVTVEPGVYVKGRFGARVEDLLLVTADGRKVLTGLDKELLIL